ncbi:MAG: YbaK/EbsC family protein [Acutalibacteraceae bacterium]
MPHRRCTAKMLSPAEVEEKIGYAVGGVCPFGVNAGVDVRLDESLRRFETVFPACGSGNSAIELSLAELEEFSAANIPAAMAKVFGYYCIFTPLSTWWGDVLTAVGWNDFLVLFGTMVINLITEFLFCRFVVYRNSIDTNEAARKKRGENEGEPV